MYWVRFLLETAPDPAATPHPFLQGYNPRQRQTNLRFPRAYHKLQAPLGLAARGFVLFEIGSERQLLVKLRDVAVRSGNDDLATRQ